MNTRTTTYSTKELCEMTGATHRLVDYAYRNFLLFPKHAWEGPGSRLEWPEREVRIAKTCSRLPMNFPDALRLFAAVLREEDTATVSGFGWSMTVKLADL
jgi:hypothetical protein